jgi:hypothetical protein
VIRTSNSSIRKNAKRSWRQGQQANSKIFTIRDRVFGDAGWCLAIAAERLLRTTQIKAG